MCFSTRTGVAQSRASIARDNVDHPYGKGVADSLLIAISIGDRGLVLTAVCLYRRIANISCLKAADNPILLENQQQLAHSLHRRTA